MASQGHNELIHSNSRFMTYVDIVNPIWFHSDDLLICVVVIDLQDNIAQLKGKMANNSKECEERNKQLREVRGPLYSDVTS